MWLTQRCTVRALLLAASLGLLACSAGRGADDKPASKAILEFVESMNKKDPKLDDKAKMLAAEYDREDVMNVFGPRDNGGIGVGRGDESIEARLETLGKKGISKADLEKQSAELKQMAEAAVAVAEVAPHYAGKSKKPELWKTRSAEFKKEAQSFLEVVKKDDPAPIRAAATKLQGSCMACHKDFKP